MANIAQNKSATASGYVAPFTPAKAVDGVTAPLNRWLCISAPPPEGSVPPSWLRVDLGEPYWVNRWVVSQLGAMGWAPTNNMVDYRFQGSLDDANWYDLDSVTNNSANQTDRSFIGKLARYVRVYITKGLRSNPPCNSIGDLQVYEATNAPYLSNLVPTAGVLSPAFNQKVFAYTVNVASSVQSIQFTPTALQTTMTIKVNNAVVTSGQPSQSFPLSTGGNPFTITVTSSDNTMTTTYSVNVVRASDTPVAVLNGLTMAGNDAPSVPLNPGFGATTFNYTAAVANSTTWVKVTPTTAPGTTTIKVNGVVVASGRQSAQINLNVGSNTITVTASGSGYTDGVYTITVTRAA